MTGLCWVALSVGHVQNGAHGCTPALDTPFTPKATAITIGRATPTSAAICFWLSLPSSGKSPSSVVDEGIADAGDGSQLPVCCRPFGHVSDELAETGFGPLDLLIEGFDHGAV